MEISYHRQDGSPDGHKFFIKFDEPLQEDDFFLLYNQTGKLMQSIQLENRKAEHKISALQLQSGVYFAKLLNNGDLIFDKIVIVK